MASTRENYETRAAREYRTKKFRQLKALFDSMNLGSINVFLTPEMDTFGDSFKVGAAVRASQAYELECALKMGYQIMNVGAYWKHKYPEYKGIIG